MSRDFDSRTAVADMAGSEVGTGWGLQLFDGSRVEAGVGAGNKLVDCGDFPLERTIV